MEIQVACARKLLTVVWSVVKNDRPYTDDADSLRISNEMSEALAEETEA